MKCPYCFKENTRVINSRESGEVIRRRRICEKCKRRFTTYERIELVNLQVIKKDGRREAFERDKLKKGILKACEKRPVNQDKIQKVLDMIEADIRTRADSEIRAKIIGDLAMRYLKKLDKVAYIRYASVYREFADLETFEREVSALIRKRR